MTAESGTHTWNGTGATTRAPELVLCALDDSLATAWHSVAEAASGFVRVHRGSVLDIRAQAVVSPGNGHGWMRGGVDAVYAQAFPGIEQQVRSTILAYHGGELPIGEAVVVPTGEALPEWLISAPTVREPGERLPDDTVHPYLAARAVFLLWRDGQFEHGTRFRDVVETIAMPGLGTGVAGVSPKTCARQIAAAWDEVFGAR
ncbi:macro domain-containing protein [Saccharomonospora xinjiangensis]|uniref:macro domain-containing protein n=1 Tax=Saccharomonospora xinjiangensis TaxID=75294 RepID=UPI00031FEA26|nr:macro domain-containing protein [Saccharomonospora xinjiangensis]